MWRPTKMIARRALSSRYNGSTVFRSLQSPFQVLGSQSQGLNIASAESPFVCCNSLHFTSWAHPKIPFYHIPRFFSSNSTIGDEESHSEGLFPQNNESYSSSSSSGSAFDFDENRDFAFSASPVSEARDENFDSGNFSFDFDERLTTSSAELEDSNKDVGGLVLNSDEYALSNDTGERALIEGENNLENPAENAEELEHLLSLLKTRGIVSSLESSLEEMNLALNEELVVRVLETPTILGENLIGFFKWVLKKRRFPLTTKVVDLLVRTLSPEIKIRDAYALCDLVTEVAEKDVGILNTGILNELISLFSKLGKGKAAFEVFNKFECFGCVPDADTYYWTIAALCRRSLFDWACSVCQMMLNAEKLPDSEKVGKIMSYLCQGKKLKDAYAIYLWAKESKKYPPQSSVNFLICSLCHKEKSRAEGKKNWNDKNGPGSEVEDVLLEKRENIDASQEERENIYLALAMLDDMSGEERKHSIKPFSFVTNGLCRIKDFLGVKKLLVKMIEAGPLPGYTIFNTVISAFSRAGEMEDAMNMIKIMKDRCLKPDIYTYAVIVSGYAEGGLMNEALKILDEAKKVHSKLSPIIYYTLIQGYCKLEQYDMAQKLLGEMKDNGVQPNAVEYNKLIKALCLKTLDWRMAEKLHKEMQELGLHLNETTKSLVTAVRELEEETLGSQALLASA